MRNVSPEIERFAIVLIRYFMIATVALCFGCNSRNRAVSHNINGITARFEIQSSTIRLDGTMRVKATYHNDTRHTVKIWLAPPTWDAQVTRDGVLEFPCLTPEVPATEVTLSPGQEVSTEDEMPINSPCYNPGPHEIRFYYHADRLADKKLAQEYLQKYPLGEGLIAWEDRGHKFTVSK
jgi:hypothetical protein